MPGRSNTILFVIVFIDLMGFGIVIPLLPLYAERYHPSSLEFGLLLSSFSAMQFLFAPVLGRLSDRFGRKPILVLSLAGSVAGYLLFGFARSIAALFAARIIDGISGGNISTAQACIADTTTPETRAKGMGMIGAAFGLGFILGPAIGGIMIHWGEAAPGLAAAALSACAMSATLLFLPETHPRGVRSAGADHASRLAPLAAAKRIVGMPAILAVYFLLTFAFANFEATFAQYLHDTLNVSAPRVAFVFVYVGILIAVVQGGLVHRLSARYGERRLVGAGTLLVALSLLFLPLARSIPAALATLVPLTLGIGACNPSLSSLASRAAGAGERGGAMGVYQSMSSLGRILGPLWGEFIFFRLGPAGPQWTGSAVAATAALLAFAWLRQPKGAAV